MILFRSILLHLSCIFLFSCGADNSVDQVYYFSKISPGSARPDQYIVQKSLLKKGRRSDTLFVYNFDGKTYKFSHCYFDQYILNDSTFINLGIDGKKMTFTRFLINKCDTIARGVTSSVKEINCYLGLKKINLLGYEYNSHRINTRVYGVDGMILRDSYFDDHMVLLKEEGDVVLGFGKYTMQRVENVPFKVDMRQRCN